MANKLSLLPVRGMFDEEGFMRNPERWNEALAVEIAECDGLPGLTEAHWRVIQSLRQHYQQFGIAPPVFQHVCYENHLGKHCIDNLFHGEREAWRIAGLPQPGEEVKAYMH